MIYGARVTPPEPPATPGDDRSSDAAPAAEDLSEIRPARTDNPPTAGADPAPVRRTAPTARRRAVPRAVPPARAVRRPPVVPALAIGLVAGLLVGAVLWAVGPVRHTAAGAARPTVPTAPVPSPTAPPGSCHWYPRPVDQPGYLASGPDPDKPRRIVTVGSPAAGEHRAGPATLTITTNHGTVVIAMDTGLTPCTVASVAHLAAKQFFANAPCITSGPITTCGNRDPDYTWADENTGRYPQLLTTTTIKVAGYLEVAPDLQGIVNACENRPDTCPSDLIITGQATLPTVEKTVRMQRSRYPAGSVLLASGGPGTNGGSFAICTTECLGNPGATLFGTVTSGLDWLASLGPSRLTMQSAAVTFG
jgi:cyclophilin family peptidyl-prolyl cis-trans isomerase